MRDAATEGILAEQHIYKWPRLQTRLLARPCIHISGPCGIACLAGGMLLPGMSKPSCSLQGDVSVSLPYAWRAMVAQHAEHVKVESI